ncbi:MAG TPA: glycosyltransferase, partial [Planctomycetota bacterium]|nr:glycosyltransferase [Planctomycetota bacterium]
MTTVLVVLYWVAVGGLCLYGANCYVLCRAFRRGRADNLARLAAERQAYRSLAAGREPPYVTVQLPIYNERYVVERLLRAVAAFDYPRARFEIQVLDDSTDDTTSIVAELAAEIRAQGFQISHLHRTHRTGYKAGALKEGLTRARGELLAIFDADFLPGPDFLQQTVPFFQNAKVGLVQTRWGHLNRDY